MILYDLYRKIVRLYYLTQLTVALLAYAGMFCKSMHATIYFCVMHYL